MAGFNPSAGSMGRMLLIAFLVVIIGSGCARSQNLGTVYVTSQDYSIEHQNGNIEGLFCDLPNNHNPYACESDYWVAYGAGLNPPMSLSLCGQCLQITNIDGGASVKACILDKKAAAGLDLDTPGFNAIDTDGQGNASGHLYCTVSFVSC
ncbi:unnamed protein product [Calypogeia fissa]